MLIPFHTHCLKPFAIMSIFCYDEKMTQRMYAYVPEQNSWYINDLMSEPPSPDKESIEQYQQLFLFLIHAPEYMPSHIEWRQLACHIISDADIQEWIDTVNIHQGDYSWLIQRGEQVPNINEDSLIL